MSKSAERDVRYFTHGRTEMLPFVPDRVTRVLEIGCGEAVFGAMLKDRYDCEVWGVEPDEASLPTANERIDHVLHGLFDDVCGELPQDHFDLLICNDVIEHMSDPDAFLAAVAPKLTADAHVVVSLPNVRYWKNMWELIALKRWRYTDAGVMDRTHLRFFTQWTIRDLFERHGYDFQTFQGINKSKSFKPLPLVMLSCGYFRDILYPQYGMRLKRRAG